MQVFVPFKEPLKTAQCLDNKRLNKQIIECNQLIKTIRGFSKAWMNHPVTRMYQHKDLFRYMNYYVCCLHNFKNGFMKDAKIYNDMAMNVLNEMKESGNEILTDEFCDQHKRRLYAKNPDHYKQFEPYGATTENWYFVDGQLLVYETDKSKKKTAKSK